MYYRDFFDTIETIKVKDPLSDFLGAFDEGIYEFSYLDIVKLSGHSCPTTAGAYLMAREALKTLYPQQRALRGDIKVEFSQKIEDGVTGVISNVISAITGASGKGGFKGLDGGTFARDGLLDFDIVDLSSFVRFTALGTQKSVAISYDPSPIALNPKIKVLMQKIKQNNATAQESQEFKKLWQDRVEQILLHSEKVLEIKERMLF